MTEVSSYDFFELTALSSYFGRDLVITSRPVLMVAANFLPLHMANRGIHALHVRPVADFFGVVVFTQLASSTFLLLTALASGFAPELLRSGRSNEK